jgi:hypothetical protein
MYKKKSNKINSTIFISNLVKLTPKNISDLVNNLFLVVNSNSYFKIQYFLKLSIIELILLKFLYFVYHYVKFNALC